MSYTTGNFVPKTGPLSGSGRNGMRTQLGRLTVSGKTGEKKVVLINELYTLGNNFQSILVQATGGAVAVELTLAPPDLALSPLQTDLWVNSTAVPVTGIVALPFMATAMRITFTNSAVVYILGA